MFIPIPMPEDDLMELVIAVIDDDEAICGTITLLLESYQRSVPTIPTSNEFFNDLTNDHKPDCAIIDSYLPER